MCRRQFRGRRRGGRSDTSPARVVASHEAWPITPSLQRGLGVTGARDRKHSDPVASHEAWLITPSLQRGSGVTGARDMKFYPCIWPAGIAGPEFGDDLLAFLRREPNPKGWGSRQGLGSFTL